MNSVLIFAILVALLSGAVPTSATAQERFRVMEYNVENLFDTIPDALSDDRAFLPDGEQQWTLERYWAKLGRLARVIAAAGGDVPVELVGLVVVENDSVIAHLTRRTSLARLGYEYLITHSLDRRGLDVALLYQPGRFRPLSSEALRVPLPMGERPTRDVLFVEGLLPTLDTLSLFVAHFPSRRGGKRETEALRCLAAKCIRHKVDSIQLRRPEALIIIMGDLNDEVHDASLKSGMGVLPAETYKGGATSATISPQVLCDLTPVCEEYPNVKGTYYYQQEWSCLDHIIVSPPLLRSESPLFTLTGKSRILAFPFLVEQSGAPLSPEVRPKRTYLGTHYHGGVSDHFPLLVEFMLTGLQ